MSKKLEGKIALITGGSRGIGAAMYEYHDDFVFETNRFLNESDRTATVTTISAAD